MVPLNIFIFEKKKIPYVYYFYEGKLSFKNFVDLS